MAMDERLVLRIGAEAKQELKALAAKEGRTASAMVRLLIKEASTERKAP